MVRGSYEEESRDAKIVVSRCKAVCEWVSYILTQRMPIALSTESDRILAVGPSEPKNERCGAWTQAKEKRVRDQSGPGRPHTWAETTGQAWAAQYA